MGVIGNSDWGDGTGARAAHMPVILGYLAGGPQVRLDSCGDITPARGTMSRVSGGWLLGLLAFAAPLAAKDAAPLVLAKGARVGVVSLIYPEVTHFHTTKVLTEGFLKTVMVEWAPDAMLADALKDRAAQMGLTLVPLAPGAELERVREDCFLNNGFNKNLPKECVLPFGHLLNNQQLQAVIVLAPGLNNTDHAGAARRKDLPDDLRGWGFVSGDVTPDGKPSLYSMTDLLLVAPSPAGPVLKGHEWGGSYTVEWTSFVPPPDLKALPAPYYAQLQPLFQGILSRETARLLDQVQMAP